MRRILIYILLVIVISSTSIGCENTKSKEKVAEPNTQIINIESEQVVSELDKQNKTIESEEGIVESTAQITDIESKEKTVESVNQVKDIEVKEEPSSTSAPAKSATETVDSETEKDETNDLEESIINLNFNPMNKSFTRFYENVKEQLLNADKEDFEMKSFGDYKYTKTEYFHTFNNPTALKGVLTLGEYITEYSFFFRVDDAGMVVGMDEDVENKILERIKLTYEDAENLTNYEVKERCALFGSKRVECIVFIDEFRADRYDNRPDSDMYSGLYSDIESDPEILGATIKDVIILDVK